MSEPRVRHWWIQKPQAHNCPYRTNGAVFQEFTPTVVDHSGGEWIRVYSADDIQKLAAVCKERDELAEANSKDCISISLHESRMQALEQQLAAEREALQAARKSAVQARIERDQARAEVHGCKDKIEDLTEESQNLQSHLKAARAEVARLKDTPGGKRLYSQMNEINRLRKALERANKRILWLIDHMQATREERHMQRQQWQREYEKLELGTGATGAEKAQSAAAKERGE